MTVACIKKYDTKQFHYFITLYQKLGDQCKLHYHAYDHVMEVRNGLAKVELWNPDAPASYTVHEAVDNTQSIDVPAGWFHQITAKVPGTITACVFNLYQNGVLLKDPKAPFDPKTRVVE